MKIIGVIKAHQTHNGLVETIQEEEFKKILSGESERDFDFAINLISGDLLKDPMEFISDDENIGAYYGDFLDKNDHYIMQTSYPSVRGGYPGIIIAKKFIGMTTQAISKQSLIRYIPELIFRSNM